MTTKSPSNKSNKNRNKTVARRRARILAFLLPILFALSLTTAALRAGSGTAAQTTPGEANAATAQQGSAASTNSSATGATGSVAASGELEYATLERVVDGDTIVVLVNGASERVRLIGIDAAESVSPDASKNTEAGRLASEHLTSELSAGQDLWLERDTSDRDKYGRLLRYVWLSWSNNPSSPAEARAKMLNAQLVAGGWAEPKTYKPDVRWASLFTEIAESRSS